MSDEPRDAAELDREPWTATLLRVLVHAVAAAVFAFPLVRGEATVAASLGAATGALLGPTLARTRLRTPALAILSLLTIGVAGLLRFVATETDLLAPSLGPATALRTGDVLFFGFAGVALVGGLRALSSRHRALLILELGAVAFAFAQIVVAHRHGAINRTFEVADPIIASGADPTYVFLTVGACGTAALVLLLMSERSLLRSAIHLAMVLLVLLVIGGTTSMLDPPPPPEAGMGLGLRPDESDEESDEDGEGGGSGGGQQDDEDLEFHDELDTSQDRVPVGVVLFHDDYSPPSGTYYFRQGAFSQYNGRRLVGAIDPGLDRDLAPEFPSGTVAVQDAPAIDVTRERVETTVALLADHTRPFALEAPVELRSAQNPNPERFKRLYRVVSASQALPFQAMLGSSAGDASWDPATWSHYTEAPPDPRYEQLAIQILDEMLPPELHDDPAARMMAITGWLGREGTYSLRSNHSSADDPTAHFLFGDKTGYCVHFAHAATYLMRAAGLPARVATGYAVQESARAGGSALLISGEVSHAWPEVYLRGFGWIVSDVAPQTVLSPPPPPPDPDLQRLLGELARGLEAVPPPEDDPVPAAIANLRDILKAIGWAIPILVALGILLLALLKIWRGLAPSFADEQAQPRVAYRATLDRLSEVAVRRRAGESREAFARRVAEVAPSFSSLTAVHVGAAFGSQRALRDAGRTREQARAVRAELAKAFPWWRRAIGWITPWSWLTSK